MIEISEIERLRAANAVQRENLETALHHMSDLNRRPTWEQALDIAARACEAIAFGLECADDDMRGVMEAQLYRKCAKIIRSLPYPGSEGAKAKA